MFEQRLQLEESQRLNLVEMAGNVHLAGWDEAEVLIRLREGEAADIKVDETDTGPAVSARRSCEIKVPHALPVAIREVKGELSVTGLDNLNAEQVRGNLNLSRGQEAVVAEVYGNLRADSVDSLRVVGTVYGNTVLKSLETGALQNVRSNVQGKNLGSLRCSRVGGNLQVKNASGSIDVDKAGGNAHLRRIAGTVTLNQVAGNLAAQDLAGGARVERIGGNLALSGQVGQGRSYHFQADGNAALSFPEDTNAHLTLAARGKLVSSLKLADMQREGGKLTGRLGEGGAEIVVETKGNAVVGAGRSGDLVEMGDDLAREIHEALSAVDLEAIGRQVEESLRGIDLEGIGQQVGEEMEQALSRLRVKLESVDWDQMGIRARQATERAMARMQRDVDRLAAKAARQQERVERHAERAARHRERLHHRLERADERPERAGGVEAAEAFENSPAGPMETETSLDEERLSILRMVEQGQISPEEAEMLLDALD